jgi:hypothetical protein
MWLAKRGDVFESVRRFHEIFMGIYTYRFDGSIGCTILIFEGDKLEIFTSTSP